MTDGWGTVHVHRLAADPDVEAIMAAAARTGDGGFDSLDLLAASRGTPTAAATSEHR